MQKDGWAADFTAKGVSGPSITPDVLTSQHVSRSVMDNARWGAEFTAGGLNDSVTGPPITGFQGFNNAGLGYMPRHFAPSMISTSATVTLKVIELLNWIIKIGRSSFVK